MLVDIPGPDVLADLISNFRLRFGIITLCLFTFGPFRGGREENEDQPGLEISEKEKFLFMQRQIVVLDDYITKLREKIRVFKHGIHRCS